MKRLVALSIAVSVAAPGAVLAQDRRTPFQAIVDQRVVHLVTVRDRELELSGRLKLHLVATEEELARNVVRVASLNLAYLDVPMMPFTDMPPRFGTDDTGVLSVTPVGPLTLEVHHGIVPGGAVLLGLWESTVELSQLGDHFQSPTGAGDAPDAVFVAPTQKATLRLTMVVSEFDLTPGRGAGQGEAGIVSTQGFAFVDVAAQELNNPVTVPRYVLRPRDFSLVRIDLTWLRFEVLRRLCVQPVRIGRITLTGGWPFPLFDLEFTGKGLAFGQPGANTQWRKGDVVFDWRPWKTIWNSSYFTLDLASGEDSSLRGEVSDSDCIEMFFVDEFDNPSTWGGGATFSSGLASAKVISSDDNAEAVCSGGACNKTHLAHELGHVMTLAHPGSAGNPAYMVNGTTGTLMCPSGFTADNPRRNSVDNENNVNNPLFSLVFAPLGPSPDCTNDANCGACFTISSP